MILSTLHRADWNSIEQFVTPNAKVLDLGCEDGSLLAQLKKSRNIQGRGVEIDQKKILSCIEKGIPVFQSDLDAGLSDYGDHTFDFVILSLTLQVVFEPEMLIKEMLRVGKKVIVSIPNFGHWQMRYQLFFNGVSPKSSHLPYEWHNTPNIRFITIHDFKIFCKRLNIHMEGISHTCISGGTTASFLARLFPNLFSEVSVFLLSA